MTKNRNITLVNCGGTISSAYDGDTITAGKEKSFPIQGVAQTVSPFSIFSENSTPALLDELYACVLAHLNGDAVVITHGTDTLSFTAAYLGLRLCGVKTPVFLVSSNYPLSDERANGYDNLRLVDAALNAGIPGGVYVPYTNPGEAPTLHFATRLIEILPFTAALYSAGNRVCARLIKGKAENAADDELVFEEFPCFPAVPERLCLPDGKDNRPGATNGGAALPEKKVLFVTPYVGYDFLGLKETLVRENAAAVLFGTHSGTVKTEGENSAAALSGLAVYLAGGTRGKKYDSLLKLPPSVRTLDNIAPITLYTKVKLAYRFFGDETAREEYILANTAGEFFEE